eukprot:2510472-Rhodomonas_salina.2
MRGEACSRSLPEGLGCEHMLSQYRTSHSARQHSLGQYRTSHRAVTTVLPAHVSWICRSASSPSSLPGTTISPAQYQDWYHHTRLSVPDWYQFPSPSTKLPP